MESYVFVLWLAGCYFGIIFAGIFALLACKSETMNHEIRFVEAGGKLLYFDGTMNGILYFY